MSTFADASLTTVLRRRLRRRLHRGGGVPAVAASGPATTSAAKLLQWWTNGTRLPVLLTSSQNGQGGGVLGDPDTTVLWGGTSVNNRGRTAYRFTLGYWFDPCQNCGWEVDYFDLGLQLTSIETDCCIRRPGARPPVLRRRQPAAVLAVDLLPQPVDGRVRCRVDGITSSRPVHGSDARCSATPSARPAATPVASVAATTAESDCLIEEGSTLRGPMGLRPAAPRHDACESMARSATATTT